jgi:cellulose synthase/poly-beta-1,6-N-acetylglucosamine synthase-like glycosyltransferase
MSDALGLLRAILRDERLSEGDARQLLAQALEREIDPLLYCAAELGLGPRLIMERAAAWAGMAYYPKIPDGLPGRSDLPILEALRAVQSCRMQLFDRHVSFAAPDFFGVLRLRRAVLHKPSLRNRICLVPGPALRDYLALSAAESLIDEARQRLARRWPYASAQLELTKPVRYGFLVAVVLLTTLILVAPYVAQIWLLPLVLMLLVAPASIRLAAVFEPLPLPPKLTRPADAELPVYSVLIPLRNEAAMVPQLFRAMRALDYPADKLDIKFVVEATSPETLVAAAAEPDDIRFSLVAVPDAMPRTKPKALDYVLPLCRGELVVVYDAEDIPDPDQLWKAAARFRDAPDLECLQARLEIDNGRQNWLTALFAGEYAGLFGVLLPALAHWRMPMPLGGTSNHFRLATLRELGGWDAFNVTEDADLGMRMARRRMLVDVLDSATHETAPFRLLPWIGQRTRWMKGWMQTFIVHNRDPGKLLAEMGLPAMVCFEVMVLGMILAPILHTGLAMVVLARLVTGQALISPDLWSAFFVAVLMIGYGSALAITSAGLARCKRLHLVAQQMLLPVYWLLMSLATIRALHELVVRPFHWFKSPHEPVRPGDGGTGRSWWLKGRAPAPAEASSGQ